MQGQFIVPTCNSGGLSLTVLLRNTARDGSLSQSASNFDELYCALKVFKEGVLLFDDPYFSTIPAGGVVEVSEANCPFLADNSGELLLIAQCNRGDGEQYFSQEHQIVYKKRNEGFVTTALVYDQMPIVGEKAKPKPILLLAPKVWISNDVNTLISFSNVDSRCFNDIMEYQWEIIFLRQNGERIHKLAINIKQNENYILNVKNTLEGRIKLTDHLQMISVVARGEGVSCAILTFLQNKKTGALALEHSLSPHYYMNGDFVRVRNEAFILPEGEG